MLAKLRPCLSLSTKLTADLKMMGYIIHRGKYVTLFSEVFVGMSPHGPVATWIISIGLTSNLPIHYSTENIFLDWSPTWEGHRAEKGFKTKL